MNYSTQCLNYIYILLASCLSFCLQAQHISDFVSLEGGTQNTDFEHPQTHTFQVIIQHNDLLTTGGFMNDQFDFTGFVPINGSSTNGYLSINHEMNPVGGVTVLDIQFDASIQSWAYTSSEAIDFSTVNGTRRNCSGTVTPLGTIVTSEESTSGDGNSDSYNDYGWNIEIDPATKQIIDHPGGLNNGDKLWALGNFKHENIVIHNNLRTVYQAEDKTPGHLYKFVADNPRDLSTGDLFVYVGPKTGNGNWVQLNNNTPEEQNTTIAQAVAVGATTFSGGEDVEISPTDGKIYVAVKGENRVYRFSDDSPLSGGSVSNFETYVGNMSYTLNTAVGSTSVAWGGGNDNLAFDDMGNLWVLQDGGNNHIWVVNNGHTQTIPQLRIFGHAPGGSEPTGITFTPDFKYLFMSFQHPSNNNSATSQPDAFQQLKTFDRDVAIVIARKELLGNCPVKLELSYPLTNSSTFQASQTIRSSAIINSNADINYVGAQCIELKSGFEVTLGAKFLAEIQGCTVITP